MEAKLSAEMIFFPGPPVFQEWAVLLFDHFLSAALAAIRLSLPGKTDRNPVLMIFLAGAS